MGRHWFYVPVLMIVGGLLSWGAVTAAEIRAEQATADRAGLKSQQAILEQYLNKQTDPVKLIRLAKQTKNSDPALLEMIADRAYQIAPKNRDVAVLAAEFHPELKAKVLEIDPLYAETQD